MEIDPAMNFVRIAISRTRGVIVGVITRSLPFEDGVGQAFIQGEEVEMVDLGAVEQAPGAWRNRAGGPASPARHIHERLEDAKITPVNFASATIQTSINGGAFATVGVMTTYADRHGRRRGRITINQANVTAIKVQVAAGTPTDSADGVTRWRIGCAYPWGTQLVVPVSQIFPLSEEVSDPAVTATLPGDIVIEAATGQPRWSTIQTLWQRKSAASLGTLVSKSLTTIWFDCNVADYPEQQWPVYRRRADKVQEIYDRFTVSKPSLTLRERVL
jgi:hypothetical protein